VRAVLGQQVSVPGARTLAGRLVKAFGDPLPTPWGTLTTLFPTADSLAAADLSGLGLTTRRAATLRSLAEAVATGRLVLDRSADRAETRRLLLSLPGIGPWTAEYVSMRALGDPDSFPGTDLGIRQALARHGATVETAQRWRPWRSYAAQQLWTSLTEGNRS
jgi:AraC family transcriptional regulator of adaptative response / DNA-3-methyladenine glycosylase II